VKVLPLTVGADPEVFVRHKATGELVSAHGLVPGTKDNPHRVAAGAVQVDGMALEFNIDPAKNPNQFAARISQVMRVLDDMVPDHDLAIQPVAEFSRDVFDSAPEEAKVLGCEPDLDAWTGQINPAPNQEVDFRTAAGHVHLGWTENMDITDPDHIEACCMMGKQLDAVLLPLSLEEDKDTKRRELYGQPGAIRVKPYGVEYRVLSNYWLASEALMKSVFEHAEAAYKLLRRNVKLYNFVGGKGDYINPDLAYYHLKTFKDERLYTGI
jgi:hypothetical protein